VNQHASGNAVAEAILTEIVNFLRDWEKAGQRNSS